MGPKSPFRTIVGGPRRGSDDAPANSEEAVMNRTFRIVLVYGVIAGLVVAAPMVALMLTLTADTAPDNGALYGYLTMIVALTAVFLGVKHYRDKVLGGAVRFVAWLLVGLAISAVPSVPDAIGWETSLRCTPADLANAEHHCLV